MLALMSRFTIELPDEFDALAPRIRCCRLTATLKNGETRVAEIRRSHDDDAADTGWNQACQKFRALATEALGALQVERVVSTVARLDHEPRVDALVALLANDNRKE